MFLSNITSTPVSRDKLNFISWIAKEFTNNIAKLSMLTSLYISIDKFCLLKNSVNRTSWLLSDHWRKKWEWTRIRYLLLLLKSVVTPYGFLLSIFIIFNQFLNPEQRMISRIIGQYSCFVIFLRFLRQWCIIICTTTSLTSCQLYSMHLLAVNRRSPMLANSFTMYLIHWIGDIRFTRFMST